MYVYGRSPVTFGKVLFHLGYPRSWEPLHRSWAQQQPAHSQFLATPNYSDLPNSLTALTGTG